MEEGRRGKGRRGEWGREREAEREGLPLIYLVTFLQCRR